MFSSGTTGLPKAVIHTHGSLRAAINHWRDALELTSADRIQVTTPPSHILGLLNIATALELGIWMRLHRRFDLDRMLSAIEADKITVEMAVAPIALALANHPKLESYDLSSLRFIMWGATPVTPSRRARPCRGGPGSRGSPPTAPASCPSSPATRFAARGSTPRASPCPASSSGSSRWKPGTR